MGTPQKKWEKDCRSERVKESMRTQPTESNSRTCRELQRLKEQTQTMYWSGLGPLHMPQICSLVCFYGTPNSGIRGCLWLFCLSWDNFRPTGFSCTVSIWMQVPSLIVTHCHVQLITLGGLVFAQGKLRRSRFGEEGGCEGELLNVQKWRLWSGCNVWKN